MRLDSLHRKMVCIGLGLWLLVAATTPAPAAPVRAAASPAKQILTLSGIKAGLCIHLGCGSEASASLIADLAAGGPELVVHGIALDDAAMARARKAISESSEKLAGHAMVEKVALKPLPYLRDLANLVVIEDMAALAGAGLTMEEVQRITAPGGSILVQQKDGAWTASRKAWPRDMDHWTHPHHGADANRRSTDGVVALPLGLRWQEGVPMNFNLWAACRAWVICNGRIYTLSTTEYENLSSAQFQKHKQEEYLVARDAFNGLPLWKLNCQTTNSGQALNYRNTAPLVADETCAYTYVKGTLAAVDGATGQVIRTYPVKHRTVRLLLSDGLIVASGWDQVISKGLWDPWTPRDAAGSVQAFDVKTGQLRWSIDVPAQGLIAADGNAYVLTQDATPATKQEVLAIELATGKIRWRIAGEKIAPQVDLAINVAGQGIVVLAKLKEKNILALAAGNGKTLWESKPNSGIYATLLPGAVWCGGTKFDVQTGKSIGSLPGIAPGMCTPPAVVGDVRLVTNSRGCSVLDLSGAKPNSIYFGGVRGGCIEGAVPAHGLFYAAQNNCRCSPAQVPGFSAFGPCDSVPSKEDFEKVRVVERGPAYGAVQAAAPTGDEGQWPMMFHDSARSSATPVVIASKLKLAWTTPVAPSSAQSPESAIGGAWRSRLSSSLTAPVSAGTLVVAASVDGGQVLALDRTSGKIAWTYAAGGRIDSPPTLHQGLCVFGSHDGWVYALRAADGELAWRTRLAPVERRMVSFAQVESVWPAIGSVLAHEGRIYASAGRSSESDGGLVFACLDAGTGQQTWAKQVASGPRRTNDVLRLSAGKLNWYFTDLDAGTGAGEVKPPPQKAAGSLEGIMDGTWTRIGTRRSGGVALGQISAEMWATTADAAFGFEAKSRACFGIPLKIAQTTSRPSAQQYLWRATLANGKQAEAMALTKDAVVLAGRTCDTAKNPDPARTAGFLMLLSATDGKILFEAPLPAPPAYQGIAIRTDAVYVTLQDGTLVCFAAE